MYQYFFLPFSAITDSCSEYNDGEKSNDPRQYNKKSSVAVLY